MSDCHAALPFAAIAMAKPRRKDSISQILGVAECVLLRGLALVEFRLQIQASAIAYAVVLGAAFAQFFFAREQKARPR